MSSANAFMQSPAGHTRVDSSAMSSSPIIPSLEDIFAKNPKSSVLQTGGRAHTILNEANSIYANAASVLRDAPEIDIETEQITNSPSPNFNGTTSRKNKPPTSVATTVSLEPPISNDILPKEKPWQKFKNQKPAQEVEEPSKPKARVAKKQTVKGKAKERTETVSRHFPAKEGIAKRTGGKLEKGKSIENLEELDINGPSCSETALRRRIDWTPPRTNSPIILESDSDNQELSSYFNKATSSKDVFQNLQHQYARKDTSSPAASEHQQQADILKKRKLIELVSTSNEANRRSTEPSPVKAVNTKKKTRTITELATAPYALPVDEELYLSGPATKESLLNYFDADGDVKALVEQQTAVMSQKKGKAKEPKAPAKPKRKKKSGTVENPILLSPSSALKQTTNQDFVFGTSSQLVREESPSTLRDLQLVIQASNQAESDLLSDSDGHGLWHAGARDIDGDLMKLDDLGFVEDSSPPSPLDDFLDINDILKPSDANEPASVRNSILQQPQTSIEAPTEPQLGAGTHNARPDYSLLNDAQLATKVSSYGFKPVKRRQAMIALLDQCWSSKNPTASVDQSRSISTSSNLNASKKKQPPPTEPDVSPKRRGRPRKNSAPEAASPKKTRGRPKKAAAKVIEIADSDAEMSISSPRTSLDEDRMFSSPPPVDLSMTDDADMSLALSPTDQQTVMFRHITKAVISAPRSQDPARPSWHEKMLLYDPIVLEDFTVWLNGAEGLGTTGYDGEVSPKDVKSWCESKSVICLWKHNSRGRERKRF
ncbi:uncharacterized protein GGS25DRAFT_508203 [Hypoxylon fragiforme]|uniref:uncharacterized protein n=1 Tax=Hypoxylon fragiforme TaxID=63214 RepID=UPI0020C5D14C|nr:uncharacterized protein GGS25DRAFT_508203 [Hypoxylon fragiforme]KAI2604424.1 hypothetical protein GGS25DRAFT_508203 [Hypoxylon fragiforme]